MMSYLRPLAIAVTAVLLATAIAPAIGYCSRTDILIVYNSSDTTTSTAIMHYYAAARDIDDSQNSPYVLGLPVTTDEAIDRAYYNANIKAPIENHLATTGIKNDIKYVVTTKNFPYKIALTGGCDQWSLDWSSVDSELCMLFQTMGTDYLPGGYTCNPYYFNTGSDFGPPFQFGVYPHHFHGFQTETVVDQPENGHGADAPRTLSYLVCRLTAYSLQGVYDIIDRAKLADSNPPFSAGWWVIDCCTGWAGSCQMGLAQTRMSALTPNVCYDATDALLTAGTMQNSGITDNVVGYVSHGTHSSFDKKYIFDSSLLNGFLGFRFLPGAIFETYICSNGLSFDSTDGTPWTTPDHPQELLGDFLYGSFAGYGGTCGLCNVWTITWSSLCGDEAKLLPLYYQGYNFAEAAYMSIPDLSWVTDVVGDPLCRINPADPPELPLPGGGPTPSVFRSSESVPVPEKR